MAGSVQRVRAIAVGGLPARLRSLCYSVDPHALFLNGPGDFGAAVKDSVLPADAVLVVSTVLDEFDCRRIALDEARLEEPLCLGFVVSSDEGFVEGWLKRMHRGEAASVAGKTAAFVDDEFVGLTIAAIEDVRGGGATAAEAAAQVQTPLAAAFLYGHSNGQCHGAGGVAICQRDRHSPRHHETRQLPCFGDAACRFDGGGAFIRVPAHDLRAEIVIDFTCFGYVLRDHVLSASDGVGKAILENPRVRALVSTFRAVGPNRHDYRLAAYLAHDGWAMGRLAGALNRARLRDLGEDVEFACLGDPRAALVRSVLDAGETSDAVVTLSRPDGGIGTACDLRIRVSPASDEVMLYSGASAAAWAPDGHAYVTIPTGRPSASLRRVPTRVARAALSFEPLIPHLDFLEHYLYGIGQQSGSLSNRVLRDALAEGEATGSRLRRMSVTLHPTVIRDGSAFDGGVVARLARYRFEQLEHLSKALLSVHQHTITARSLLFLAGADALCAIGPQLAGLACAYCGAATTHTKKGLPGSLFERTAAFCDRCGRLFEGAGCATVIDVEAAHRRWTVRVQTVNPFPFDVPVSGVAALQTFDGCNNQVSAFEAITLGPGEAGVLCGEIVVPDEVPQGMHRTKAAVTVGPQVELLLRNYLVTS